MQKYKGEDVAGYRLYDRKQAGKKDGQSFSPRSVQATKAALLNQLALSFQLALSSWQLPCFGLALWWPRLGAQQAAKAPIIVLLALLSFSSDLLLSPYSAGMRT